MKYFLAILACGAEIIAYAVIGALLGWKRGGGIIPMLILFAAIGWTWRNITKSKKAETAVPPDNYSETSPPEVEK